MPRFEPVHLPPDRALNGRVTQTFLRHMNACPRSGFLYAQTRGEVRTVEMMRGSAVHKILEMSTKAAIEQGEPMIPGDIVKVIAEETLADPAYPVPLEEHDYIRETAWRFGSEATFDPSAVVACETLFVLRLAGYDVRCRVDFAELLDGGAALHVVDYKSGRGAPSQEEIARVRPDGSLAAKSFQLVLYALALAFGVPVREEDCAVCLGLGDVPDVADGGVVMVGDPRRACEACAGKGRIETPEPFPLAARAQRFDVEYVFPGIENKEGKMLRRPLTLSRLELEEYRSSLEGLLVRVRHAEATGDWPAVVSDAACGECPAASLCPIPAELRDHRGTVNTMDEAAEAAAKLYREKAEHRARQTELRNFAKANGAIRFDGMVMDFEYGEAEEIRDKEAMWNAVERARLYGEPFDRAEHVRVKPRSDFRARAVTADELAEEAVAGG